MKNVLQIGNLATSKNNCSNMKLVTNEYTINCVDESHIDVNKLIEELCANGPREEPLYIANVDDIVNKHKNWIAKMPRVSPFYAVKCNDSNIVLATLAALGTGFDCASKGEIQKVLALNVAADRIIFANPTKPASHIRYAAQNDVTTMTFDSEIELYKIKEHYPDASVVLRIRCEASTAQCPLGNKFGCDPATEAPNLIKVAQVLDLNLVGISFHVGSGCGDYQSYYKAIKICKVLFDTAAKYGFNLNLLDIGGGFPGDKGKVIDEAADWINQGIDTFFPADCGVKIIAEPGRYYVSSAFTLITNIHSKKVCTDIATKHSNMMYYINDGVYGSFNSQLYDHQICVPKLLRSINENGTKQERTFKSVIFGPSCDGLDTISENIDLPELDIGDIIYWENMGAYTMVCASPFNGFPTPIQFSYVGKDTW